MDQRIAQRRLADEAALVIDRLPGRLSRTLWDRDRRVLDNARRAEAVFQRREVDEGLEGGARLPLGLGRAIELALLKRPAADQRVDASGLRIHGGEAAADIGDLPQRELGCCRNRSRAAFAGW